MGAGSMVLPRREKASKAAKGNTSAFPKLKVQGLALMSQGKT